MAQTALVGICCFSRHTGFQRSCHFHFHTQWQQRWPPIRGRARFHSYHVTVLSRDRVEKLGGLTKPYSNWLLLHSCLQTCNSPINSFVSAQWCPSRSGASFPDSNFLDGPEGILAALVGFMSPGRAARSAASKQNLESPAQDLPQNWEKLRFLYYNAYLSFWERYFESCNRKETFPNVAVFAGE